MARSDGKKYEDWVEKKKSQTEMWKRRENEWNKILLYER